MSDLATALAELRGAGDGVEFVVGTVTSISPLTVTWNGTDITNPPSLSFTPVAGAYVACLRQGAAFFVLGPIVKRS